MIKAVIFDLDNTLYNYDEANKYAELCVAEWLLKNKNVGINVFREIYKQSKNDVKKYTSGQGASHNRMLYFQRFCECMHWLPTDCALELYDVYWNAFLDKIELYEGTINLFDFLKEKRIKIAICTELTAHIQHRKIRKLGIDKYLDVLVTSEEAGSEKQGLIIFNIVIEKLGISKEDALFIGDNYNKDVCGANKAGIEALLFDPSGMNSSVCSMIEIQNYIKKKGIL